jgi:hypothetical protein
LVEYCTKVYVLAAIEHGTRRIRIIGATDHPVQSRVVQRARKLLIELEDAGTRVKFVLHDRTPAPPPRSTPSSRLPASRSSAPRSASRSTRLRSSGL